jgi:peptidyl-prolyl cis-trans isomerase C
MIKMTLRGLLLGAAMTLALPVFAADDTKAKENTDHVVATVNGAEIYYSEVLEAQQSLGQQMQAMPVEMVQGLLVNSIADRKLVAAEALKDKLNESESYKKRLATIEEHLLQREFLTQYAESNITDEKVKAAYDKMVAEFKPVMEVHARHILVEKEDEAKALIKELENGKDFAELAKAKSTGPSGPNGGDLGFFSQGQMVPEFEKAAFGLKKEEFTKVPVKTQFGYHVIKVEEFRKSEAPKQEDIAEQLKGQIANEAVTSYLAELRKSAKIVMLDKDGKEIKTDK